MYGQDHSARVSFARQNDFTWITQAGLNTEIEKGRYSSILDVQHTNIYNTSLSDNKLAQFQIITSFWNYYKLKERISLAGWLETEQFLNTGNHRYNLYGGIRLRPTDSLEITPMIGYTADVRNNRQDQGITPALRIRFQDEPQRGLTVATSGFFRYKSIQPRRQINASVSQTVIKEFSEQSKIRADLTAGSFELNDYVSSSVKRIATDSIAPSLLISYEILPGLSWTSDNQAHAVRRRFGFVKLDENGNPVNTDLLPPDSSVAEFNDLRYTEYQIHSGQSVSLARKKIRLNTNYEFTLVSRRYLLKNSRFDAPVVFSGLEEQEKLKDFDRNQSRFQADLLLSPWRRHAFDFHLINQYVMYNTPSESNFDDRDELNWSGTAQWKSRWTQKFRTELELTANRRKYAFLFAERSAENYVQRFLKLNWGYSWDLIPALNIDGEAAVYVTYNVKDFGDPDKTDRSTRNLETNLRATWKMTPSVETRLTINRKEIHQSWLNWDQFTETTLDTNTIRNADLSVQWNLRNAVKSRKNAWFLKGGYRHFGQTKRLLTTMIGLDGLLSPIWLHKITNQTGPHIGCGLRGKNATTLDATIWLQTQQRLFRYGIRETGSLTGVPENESALTEKKEEFRPFITLSFNHYFR